MIDSRLEKLADLLVNYSVTVRAHDKVAILGGKIASPLLKQIYIKTLQAGGFPMIYTREPEIDELLYQYGSREQIEYIHEAYRIIAEKYDVRIVVLGDENTRSLTRVDPGKTVWYSQARKSLSQTMMQRSATGELRWVIAPYPTNAYAQDAEMSLNEYEDFLFKACMPDITDPIGYWQKLSVDQTRITSWLANKNKIHLTGLETDLWLDVSGRKFINCDGHFNIPDGEVFTGPVENSAEGQVYFSYPAIENGHEVTGIRLWFHQGKVIKATADKGEEFLNKTLDTDQGSRYIGEFAIGTNKGITAFTREILFDEKIGGSFHLALGMGYPESGSLNQSAIHWDMVCDLRNCGEITADGELLYRDGNFVI